DIDHCLIDGKILDWAKPYLRQLSPTYMEVSPSGTGIKGIVKAQLPGKGMRKTGIGDDGSGAIEFYDCARYFTITGNSDAQQNTIVDRSNVVVEIYRELHPERLSGAEREGGTIPPEEDDILLDKARQAKNGDEFAALFDQGEIPSR